MSDFECPVCLELMRPPIHMCVNGHNFCEDCFSKISVCALCKKGKSQGRNYTLENMFEKITFPCKYECSFSATGQLIGVHEDSCTYYRAICPFPNCNWSGNKKEFEKHMVKKSHKLWSCPDFLLRAACTKSKEMLAVAKLCDTYFVFVMKLNKNCLHLALYEMYNPRSTYKYKISLEKGHRVAVKFNGTCGFFRKCKSDWRSKIRFNKAIEFIEKGYKFELSVTEDD